MNVAILSLGSAIPPHSLSQIEIGRYLAEALRLEDEEAWMLERIYRNSCIERRYSVLPYLLSMQEKVGMSERNQIYRKEAPLLAEQAAKAALARWNKPADQITHVLSVSCTGAMTPGIEFKLAQALKLPQHVYRLGINFMGCYGAFKGLSVASHIARANPKNRVLVVCTELCTLHFKPAQDIESAVIQSLFADGASAAIVGVVDETQEKPLFEIVKEASCLLENSEEEMSWHASSHGFEMTLSAKVPKLIEEKIAAFVATIRPQNTPLNQLDFPIHPGGKAILEAVEKALLLNKQQTQSSWTALSKYGNLSSASFLCVLDELKKKGAYGPYSLGLGFGPGLAIEGLLLRNV